ncbi:MAG TPA: DUF2282 domain-containing protein [Burkholderiaceae bacterium]|nr:DUF2282 domain-containing protein [Burkholderiaceae bacterium]
MLKHSLAISSALASAIALGLVGSAAAASHAAKDVGKDGGKEKCYGIAKAGQNDCANLSGTHSCAGQSKNDLAADEWKYVAKGTCKEMKGLSAEEAKAKTAKK